MFETKKTRIPYVVPVFGHSLVQGHRLWPSVKGTESEPHILAARRLELSGLLHLTGQLSTISCFLPKINMERVLHNSWTTVDKKHA